MGMVENIGALNIGIVTAGLSIDPQRFGETALGGSETALICMARALGRQGQKVMVFCVLDGPQGQIDPVNANVQYFHVNDFDRHIQIRQFDAMIVSRHIGYALKPMRTGTIWYWAHDIAPQTGFDGSVWPVERMLFLSKFHQGLYEEVLPAGFKSFMRVTRNGIERDRIERALAKSVGSRRSNRFCYTSRPERGAMFLLGSIWPRIRQLIPDAELHLAWYEVKNMAIAPDVQRDIDFVMHLVKQSAAIGVTFHGALPKDDLYRLMASCNALLYPSTFPESSCITAIEAMALGATPITTNAYALTETLAGHGRLINGTPGESSYDEAFVDAAVEIAVRFGDTDILVDRLAMMDYVHNYHSWDTIAAEWVANLKEFFVARFELHEERIYDNLLYHSDAATVKKFTELREPTTDSIIAKHNAVTIIERSQDEKEEYLAGNSHQHWKENARFLKAIELMKPVLDRPTTKMILDVGCGSGNFLACLHVRYPWLDLVGVDFSIDCIDEARKFIREQGLDESKFHFHVRKIEDTWPTEVFDAVFCGEVLEHIEDTQGMLEKLEYVVRNDGMVCITTPLGPWSAIAKRDEGRSNIERHVQHFSSLDLKEILGKRGTVMTMEYLSAGTSERGEPLGNLITAWQVMPERRPFGKINLWRKVLTTRPYQRLSVVMIVKDEEDTLMRCLKSLRHIADEIIIGDTGSTDSTRSVIERYGESSHDAVMMVQVPYNIDGDGIGNFSAWRNLVLVEASGDWILAIDADEVLSDGRRLRRYLETPSVNAFSINQVSMNLDRAADIQQPQRLFRNGKGYQYKGVIHEHLQTDSDGFEFVEPFLILPDVTLPHDGYLQEEVRYRKTAIRNLPMLLKDRRLYPDRVYGVLLEMRDVINMCKWSRSKFGVLRPQDVEALRQLLLVYAEHFGNPGHIFYAQATQYYQDALAILAILNVIPYGQRHVPIQAQLQLVAAVGPLTQQAVEQARPIVRWFQNTEEIRSYIEDQTALMERALEPIMSRVAVPAAAEQKGSLLEGLSVP